MQYLVPAQTLFRVNSLKAGYINTKQTNETDFGYLSEQLSHPNFDFEFFTIHIFSVLFLKTIKKKNKIKTPVKSSYISLGFIGEFIVHHSFASEEREVRAVLHLI